VVVLRWLHVFTGAVLQQLAGYVLMVWAHRVNLLPVASSLIVFADSASVRLDRSSVGDDC